MRFWPAPRAASAVAGENASSLVDVFLCVDFYNRAFTEANHGGDRADLSALRPRKSSRISFWKAASNGGSGTCRLQASPVHRSHSFDSMAGYEGPTATADFLRRRAGDTGFRAGFYETILLIRVGTIHGVVGVMRLCDSEGR